MKHLIVAIDFSKESENALEYAGALAEQVSAKVIIFNSFALPVQAADPTLPASVYQEILDQNIHMLKTRATALANSYGIEVTFEPGSLDVPTEIEGMVQKYRDSLLIMGMAAQSWEQDIFGNTTTSIMMKLKHPVLAVPLSVRFKGIDKILYAWDGINETSVLKKVRDLAYIFGSEIEIFHVNITDEPRNSSEEAHISNVLGAIPHYFKQVHSTAVIDEIEKEIKDTGADLLMMIPRKYSFFQAMLNRSKTRIMASNNNVPLLSLPLIQD